MAEIDDGGPAFPMPEELMLRHYDAAGEVTGSTETFAVEEQASWSGMTLLDYFAARAMEQLLAARCREFAGSSLAFVGLETDSGDPKEEDDEDFMSDAEAIAGQSYVMANAMIKARTGAKP